VKSEEVKCNVIEFISCGVGEFVRCRWWCSTRFFHLHDYCSGHENSAKLHRREIILICGAGFSWMSAG